MIDGYIETVRVVSEVSHGNPFGFVTINKADLTDAQVIFEGPNIVQEVFEQPNLQQTQTNFDHNVDNVELSDNDPTVTSTGAKKPWDAA